MSTSEQTVFRPVPFNFEDIQEKADEYLKTVRAEVARIAAETRDEITKLRDQAAKELAEKRTELAATQKRLETLETNLKTESAKLKTLRKEIETANYDESRMAGKKQGYDEGHAEGYGAGEKKALLDYEERVKTAADRKTGEMFQTLMPALQTAIENLSNAENTFVTKWEQGVMQVAVAIAQQAIARELPNMIDVPLKLLREAIELAVGSVRLKIRMNPNDVESLQPEIETLIREITPAAEAEVVADIRISPGGCYLETTQGTIDQRIESRLERIKMELTDE